MVEHCCREGLMNMGSKVLVIAAHPDDEVLGCGGTIKRFAGQGDEVYIAIMGEGITSRFQQRKEADFGAVAELQQKSRRVAETLGAKDIFLYDLPDNRFDTVPLLDIVKKVEELVKKIRPDVIFTHHAGDLNIDHVILHRAVLTATRPADGSAVREIYAFEVPSSTEWAFSQYQPVFMPNTFIEISGTIAAKKKCMEIYDSEARKFPHPRSAEALDAIAAHWGSAIGRQKAEAFMLVRSIR